jgi:hypothetical protein
MRFNQIWGCGNSTIPPAPLPSSKDQLEWLQKLRARVRKHRERKTAGWVKVRTADWSLVENGSSHFLIMRYEGSMNPFYPQILPLTLLLV